MNKINMNGDTQIVMAYGISSTLGFHEERKAFDNINFVTGGVFSLRSLHSLLMAFGWAILYIGSFYISLASSSNNIHILTKRKIHSIFEIIGSVIILVGFIISIVMMLPGPHFSSPVYHSQIGIITIALTTIEVIIGIILYLGPVENEKSSSLIIAKTLHKWLGWSLLGFSLLTIGLGVFSLFNNVYNFWFGIVFGSLAAMAILGIITGISKIFYKTTEPNYTELENNLSVTH